MPDQSERRDDPEARVDAWRRLTGSVSPWNYSRITDEALTHAGAAGRVDPQAASRPWRPLGPRNVGGRIRSLAQDERNPDTLYAGSGQGGLWKTEDGGDSWRVLDDFRPPGVPQGLPVGAVAVSYSNPEIVYVGTGEPTRSVGGGNRDIPGNGLYRSIDGGGQFQQIDPPDPGTGVIGAGQYERIVVDPWEPRRLWIATPDRGLARGTPSGGGSRPTLRRDNVDTPGAPPAGTQQASDVMVDFGPQRNRPPATVTVYVALWGDGVYRAIYDRGTDRYRSSGGRVWTRITPGFTAGFTRVKLALCSQQPNWIAAVAGLPRPAGTTNDPASHVFISRNRGNAWVDTGRRRGDDGTQARYDLVLAMHPRDPAIIVTGSVELFLGRHNAASGRTRWRKIIDWTRHDRGDRAQHADQHALLFDAVNPRRLWVGNDGGLSSSADLGSSWRERGLGISAAQFYALTTHPVYPYIYGGGFQDNGTWLSYGGQSWHHINGADGGELGFDPGDPRRLITSWQSGLDRTVIRDTTNRIGSADYMNRVPDVPERGGRVVNQSTRLTTATGFATADRAPFAGVLAAHPGTANHAIAGRRRRAYRTTDGRRFRRMRNLQAFNPVGSTVSVVAYSPQNPDTRWWVATERGELFSTTDGDASAWVARAPAGAAGNNITAIAINPNNDAIVAISVALPAVAAASQGRVFLSGDSGRNWCEISGRTNPCRSLAGGQLNPSPASALVFDPASPAGSGADQTLYCGCLTGVYVIRNARAPTAAGSSFIPRWRTFNNALPLTLVFDLEMVRYQDSGGQSHRLLRCGTHARGAFECDLAGAPAVRLLIRDNVVDDGRSYAAAHRVSNNRDPRLADNAGNTMVLNRSIDIRIDTPPYRFLGQIVDGVEFDDLLRSDDLAAGKLNVIHVQVHNTGAGDTSEAQVHLFWAQAETGPVRAPELQATFWSRFPDPAEPGTWQRIGTVTPSRLPSGTPRVLAFRWQVPGTLSGNIALLVICTDPASDPLDGSTLGRVVDPAADNSFIGNERRTALYLTRVRAAPADAGVRDGFDDTGLLGETAWGARSHDIIVVQRRPTPSPNAAFADASDIRAGDLLDGSARNRIFVRVHNRGGQRLRNVAVEVFRVPAATPGSPNTWESLGQVVVNRIDAGSARIAAEITWRNPPDPGATGSHLLAAVIGAQGDPRPNFLDRVNSVASFWELFLEAVDSGNAALRGLPWRAGP